LSSLTIGSQPLTISSGNGYGLTFANATTMSGNMFLNTIATTVFSGDITDGGTNLFINKIGTGTLFVNSSTNLLGGGVYINAGRLDFGDRLSTTGVASLGIGPLNINADADIVVRGAGNINVAQGQRIVLNGTAYAPAVLLPTVSFTQADYQGMIQSSVATSNAVQMIAFGGGTLNNNLDQSSMGGGRMFFGANSALTYTGSGNGTLSPGLPNLPNSIIGNDSTNPVYRHGGRTTNTLTIDLAGIGKLTDVGGPTDLQVGSLANLGPSANWGFGQVLLTDLNTYTGNTTVVRGSTLRFNTAPNALAGPLGAPGIGTIHAYGVLQAEGSATFANPGNTANAYNNVVLHPGSELRFQNNDATVGSTSNRWQDSVPVA
jgi:autotransporter-associated beta strand protein